MSALIVRLPKRDRLKLIAKARQVSVTRLIEEMATVVIADFDAETRFASRAARGRGQTARGKLLLDKARSKSRRAD